ncbi:MAG: hypothetical protein JXA73_01800 [Acidobacteria bacterium]|nr:hypothetical protein [Acidobacteriota bacterium]
MKNLVKLALCLVLFPGVVRMGFSRGDKIIPQVVAGGGWITKFDLINVSSDQDITNMRLAFYDDNGSPWSLETNQGTGHSFTLSIGARQTLQFQAIGGSSGKNGYAVLYDEEEGNSDYSEDYVLGISVFYQFSNENGITENVSIPVREPTAVVAAPVEINSTQGIYSAVAIVNAADVSNTIELALYDSNGNLYQTKKTITLAAGQQRTAFLDHEQDLFYGLQSFSGMVEIVGERPFVLLSLRQTRAADFNQEYTLLVPVDKEALRRNSYMVLLQASTDEDAYMPIDIDGFTSDFYRTTGGTEAYSWDLEYWYDAPDTEDRFFKPVNFSGIVSLGIRNDAQFDAISLPDLKARTDYSSNELDISTAVEFQAFAIRTDLGNYAKARIIRVIDTWDGYRNYQDLLLEVIVYR